MYNGNLINDKTRFSHEFSYRFSSPYVFSTSYVGFYSLVFVLFLGTKTEKRPIWDVYPNWWFDSYWDTLLFVAFRPQGFRWNFAIYFIVFNRIGYWSLFVWNFTRWRKRSFERNLASNTRGEWNSRWPVRALRCITSLRYARHSFELGVVQD